MALQRLAAPLNVSVTGHALLIATGQALVRGPCSVLVPGSQGLRPKPFLLRTLDVEVTIM